MCFYRGAKEVSHHGQVFGKCFFTGGRFMGIYKLTLYLHLIQKVFTDFTYALLRNIIARNKTNLHPYRLILVNFPASRKHSSTFSRHRHVSIFLFSNARLFTRSNIK